MSGARKNQGSRRGRPSPIEIGEADDEAGYHSIPDREERDFIALLALVDAFLRLSDSEIQDFKEELQDSGRGREILTRLRQTPQREVPRSPAVAPVEPQISEEEEEVQLRSAYRSGKTDLPPRGSASHKRTLKTKEKALRNRLSTLPEGTPLEERAALEDRIRILRDKREADKAMRGVTSSSSSPSIGLTSLPNVQASQKPSQKGKMSRRTGNSSGDESLEPRWADYKDSSSSEEEGG